LGDALRFGRKMGDGVSKFPLTTPPNLYNEVIYNMAYQYFRTRILFVGINCALFS